MLDIDLESLDEDIRKAVEEWMKFAKRVEDLTEFWKKSVRPSIIYEVKQVFETDGWGSWAKRKDDEPHPLLRKTGKLYNSWIKTGAPGNVFRFDKRWMEWGSSIPYGKYHEWGTSKMVERPIGRNILGSNRGGKTFESRLNKLITRYILRKAKRGQ